MNLLRFAVNKSLGFETYITDSKSKNEVSLQAGSSVIKHNDIGVGGLGFDSEEGQIKHSVANGSPLLRRFFGAV